MALATLNAAQREAVTTTEGAIRVMAGPGTGKTRTLTERYCYLVDAAGVAPGNILCVTFTNRAANEMKRRVRAELGDCDLGYLCTFHAFCVQLLKEDIHVINYPANFLILDMDDLRQLLLKIFADMGLGMRELTVQRALDEILEARKFKADSYIDELYQLDLEQLRERITQADERNDEIFLRYLYEQKKCFGLDFNDLINVATWILEHFPAVRQKWQQRMQYVMVDEFQDVSKRQYRLAQLLSGKHGNLFIVGDPDQTIYSWRGAHVRLFLDFDQVYPQAKTIVLSDNYRSTPEILAVADSLIAKNSERLPKSLQPHCASGPTVLYRHCLSEQEEAEWLVQRIDDLLQQGVSANAIAVLYRAHYQSRALEEALIAKGIAYTLFSGIAFYSRREIKDVICYLRMVAQGDDIAFLRTINVPPRRIGKKKLDWLQMMAQQQQCSLYRVLCEHWQHPALKGAKVQSYISAIETTRQQCQQLPLDDLLQTVLDRSGYEALLRTQGEQERLDNLVELKRAVTEAAADPDMTLDDFLARIALYTALDEERYPDTVKLMTIHGAKGMEFSRVFVCGLNEGVFPSRKVLSREEMEEERRLAYVAMTRAKEALVLTDAEGIANDGLVKFPSRFLFDIDESLLSYDQPLPERLRFRREADMVSPSRTGEIPAFAVGDRVQHAVFGVGTIVAIQPQSYSIQFDVLPTERSIQLSARLETVDVN